MRSSLKRLEIGSIMNTAELLKVCRLLETCSRIKAYSRRENDETPERFAG